MGFFLQGLKKEFETAMVNESSVFEPLKFYCNYSVVVYTIRYHQTSDFISFENSGPENVFYIIIWGC